MVSRIGVFLVRCLIVVVAWLPPGLTLWFARRLADLLFLVGFKKAVMLQNLEHVFGERYPEAERVRIARLANRNVLMTVIEMLRGSHPRSQQATANQVTFSDVDLMVDLDKDARGVLFVVSHSGNLDLPSVWWGTTRKKKVWGLMKPLENPYFNDLLVATRESFGCGVVSTKAPRVSERINEILARGEAICILPDQNARRRGVTVDFLGKPASTYKGAAATALENPSTRVVVAVPTRPYDDQRIVCMLDEVLDFEPTGDRDRDLRDLTQRFCDSISGVIEKHPGSYLWHHRRWGRL
jgi:KDO2-lipid IV(A) lauroyltransferase